ncbi:GntR family transcriptional regulator [Oscillospiraceae bacterium MB08-C2-2]|nr:GntR family transcriptional regulator [Oscillospiraceae bacterium MB08-C2-2]
MPTKSPDATPKKMLVDIAFENIRKDISQDILRPGERLNTRLLSQQYGISETPIKQALNRLMMQGVVESVPRKGMRVRSMKWEEIDEILDLRLMLELNFVDQVLLAVSGSMPIQKLFEQNIEESLESVERIKTPKDFFYTFDLDRKFHRLYLVSSGNRKAVQVYDNLNTHAFSLYLYDQQPPKRTLEGVVGHKLIYEALKQNNREKVIELLNFHTKHAKETINLLLRIGRLT